MGKASISIQQKKDQISLKIHEQASNEEIIKELKKKIPELKKLYGEEKTPILVTGKVLKNKEIEEIEKLITGTINVKIEFDSPKDLGLYSIKKTFENEIQNSDTMFHKGALRSGQKLEYEGSIVLMGDLNGGAEITAGENIAVVGVLRGVAHAGAKGNKKAIITAASIEAPQLRIANIVKEMEKEDKIQPKTFAYVDDEKIILE